MPDLSEMLARRLLAWINADAQLHEAIALVMERLSAYRDASSVEYSTVAPDVQLTLSHIGATHHANVLQLYASLVEKIERFEHEQRSTDPSNPPTPSLSVHNADTPPKAA